MFKKKYLVTEKVSIQGKEVQQVEVEEMALNKLFAKRQAIPRVLQATQFEPVATRKIKKR